MALNPSKEAILKRIRQAYTHRNNLPTEPNFTTDIYSKSEETDLSILFAQNFIKHKGEFYFIENESSFANEFAQVMDQRGFKENVFVWEKSIIELIQNPTFELKTSEQDFVQAEVGITSCEYLVARTGSILVASGTESGRRLSIYPHVHIVIARVSQIVYDIQHALSNLRVKYPNKLPSMISLETGPSRTADIEKTLVLGAHGPKELILFLIDDVESN
jgi:L-lactate dehydrogenase complex protein LldG